MDSDINPYNAPQTGSSIQLTLGQKLLAVGIGSVVLLASVVVMTAFLFGLLIAVQGQNVPTPINPSALVTNAMLRWIIPGGAGIAVIGIFLGLYSMFRVLNVQRSLLEAAAKRRILQQHVESIRRLKLES